MLKNLIAFVVILIAFKEVVSLECYITDLKGGAKPPLTHSKGECNLSELGASLPVDIIKDLPFNCFKIVGTGPQGDQAEFKGCVPKGFCEPIVETFQRQQQNIDLRCYECEGENCNPGSKFSPMGLFVTVLLLICMKF